MRAAQMDPSPAAAPKSRLKRLFERQVLRVSPASRLPPAPAPPGGGEKDELSEPSSLCLDGMVRSFLEDGGGAVAERGAAARCCNCFHAGDTSHDEDGPAAADADGMVRSFLEDGGGAVAERGAAARCCNCFHAGDTSHDEDGPAAADAAAADIAETIKGLVHCASLRERNHLADVSTQVERHRASGARKRELLRLLAESLRAAGHDAAVYLSRWDKSASHPAVEHAYLDVLLPAASERGERVLVDVDFRSVFEVARHTKAYRAVLQRLPSVFVGRDDRLRLLAAAAADAARASLKKRGLHLPPRRKLEYMRAKWLSPYDREDPPPPPQPEATTGELAGDGKGGGPSA